MTHAGTGTRCSRLGRTGASAQRSHRSRPSTRREWLQGAGAGFGGLALIDLLSRDLSRPWAGADDARLVGCGGLASKSHGAERHFLVHGRWTEPYRHL